jgi:hypothetical protein
MWFKQSSHCLLEGLVLAVLNPMSGRLRATAYSSQTSICSANSGV